MGKVKWQLKRDKRIIGTRELASGRKKFDGGGFIGVEATGKHYKQTNKQEEDKLRSGSVDVLELFRSGGGVRTSKERKRATGQFRYFDYRSKEASKVEMAFLGSSLKETGATEPSINAQLIGQCTISLTSLDTNTNADF